MVEPLPPSALQHPAPAPSGNAMEAAVRALDWTATSLGAQAAWPPGLQALVATLLHSRQPMVLWWGPEHLQIYNDAFDSCFGGGRFPGGIGRRGADCWGEMWPDLTLEINRAIQQRAATWHRDTLIPVWRDGRLEDVYWTYGFSPAFDDAMRVGGVLVICTETTRRVVSERRQKVLARMAAAMADAHSLPEIGRKAVEVANDAPGDIERALVCRLEAGVGWVAHFAQSEGDMPLVQAELTRRLDPAASTERLTADLMPGSGGRPNYARAQGPTGPGERLCIAPVARPPAIWDKVMVIVPNPRLPFDAAYLDFIDQYLDMVMAALLRVDAAQVRESASIERDSVLLQAPVPAALMIGPEHRYRLANDRYCAMIGRVDIAGKTYREVFPELEGTGLPEIMDRAYERGESFTSDAMRVPLRLQGAAELTDCYFLLNLQPLRHSNGEVYGLMTVATDVTAEVTARETMERVHAERQALVEELKAANRVKDEFLAMLGHELRNPLSPIVTAVQVMKLRGDTGTEREQATIERQVDHLVRLVDDLLDVSRIARGRIELKKERIDAGEAIDRAVEMASFLFEQRRHQLHVDKGAQPLYCDGDPTRLAQAVANLLTNAARYTPQDGRIWLSARHEGSEIVIEVKDDGIGIDPVLLPRVFDLFVQGERGIDRAEGGLGIGLALVKNLIELHGGSVGASSEGADRGSRFWLRLPAAQGPSLPHPPQVVAEGNESLDPARPAQRVLLVDDNVDAAESLAEVLWMMGHDVTMAHTPMEALAIATRVRTFDVVIMDIGLPGMSGYELAPRMRQVLGPAGGRFVALTGYGQSEDQARSLAAGFEVHMVKPVELEALDRVLSGGLHSQPGPTAAD